MACDEEHYEDGDDGCHRYGEPFGGYKIKIKHQGYPRGDEEKGHVGDEEFADGADSVGIDYLAVEEKRQDKHSPDATGDIEPGNECEELAQCETTEYDAELLCHAVVRRELTMKGLI